MAGGLHPVPRLLCERLRGHRASVFVLTILCVLEVANCNRSAPPFVGVASSVLAQALGIGLTCSELGPLTFKYAMWASSLVVIEHFDGCPFALLAVADAVIAFSFVVAVGVNRSATGYLYCCSSYTYLHLLGCSLVSVIDAGSQWSRRAALALWPSALLAQVAYDDWVWDHHALAFTLGSGCRVLRMRIWSQAAEEAHST